MGSRPARSQRLLSCPEISIAIFTKKPGPDISKSNTLEKLSALIGVVIFLDVGIPDTVTAHIINGFRFQMVDGICLRS